jgi:membrane fusion protein, multidrug efflux system
VYLFKRTFNGLLLPALLLALVAGCKPQAEQTQKGAMPGGGMPPPEVEVVIVKPKTVPRTVEVPGRLQAVRTAEVRARVEGILERRVYREGSDVKAGQVLFRIDPRTLTASVESARATLARARAQAVIAGQNLERMQALVGTKAISKQEYDQAVAAKSQSDADVAAAQAAVAQAEISLSYAKVTAPISGRAGRALVTEGALVGSGQATPLTTIEQYDPIWANFSQASADFLNLREAMKAGQATPSKAPVRLVLENGQEYKHPGKLLFNDLAVDPATGSVGIRAEFPNSGRELLPGQFVTVRLPVAQAENVIVVPQPVKTGGLSGSDWIVSEGLKGGEQVIVNGVQKVRPGMTVKAVSIEGVAAGGHPQSTPPAPSADR